MCYSHLNAREKLMLVSLSKINVIGLLLLTSVSRLFPLSILLILSISVFFSYFHKRYQVVIFCDQWCHAIIHF